MKTTSLSQIGALDGLRAVAILLVLFRHAADPVKRVCDCELVPLGSLDLGNLMINGWVGVDLFFVVSGFLIGRNLLLLDEANRRFSWPNYAKRRAKRILPSYFAVMAVIVAGMIPLYQVETENLLFRVTYHVLFLQDYFKPDLIVAFWSLGVEAKFYLIAPFLIIPSLLAKSNSARYALVFTFALAGPLIRTAIALRHGDDMSYGEFFPLMRAPFHACLDGLGTGVIVALIEQRCRNRQIFIPPIMQRAMFLCGGVVLVGILISDNLLAEISIWDQVFQPTILAICFGAVTLAAALTDKPGFLGSRPMMFIGRISYPLYLVHMAVIPLSWALTGIVWPDLVEPTGAALWTFLPIYMLLSVSIALVVHYTVERPFLSHRRRSQSASRSSPA